MTATTAPPPPADVPSARRRAPGSILVQVTAVVALVGIVLALVGIALASRPLRTPSQDCGTAVSYLLGGRVDEFVDPANPPEGVTKAEAEDNNADPCQERAANRARPAGVLVLVGALLGVGALFVEFIVRYRLYRQAIPPASPFAHLPPPPTTAPPPPPATTSNRADLSGS